MTTPHAAMVERAERLLAAVEGMTRGTWVAVACSSPRHAASVAYENKPGAEFILVSGGDDTWDDADQRDIDAEGIVALRNDAPEIIRSLLQALEAERGWRTIESAPKDGTKMLLNHGGLVCRGWWEAQKYHKKPRPYWDSDRGFMGVQWHRDHQPTHWMPLPTPPAATLNRRTP